MTASDKQIIILDDGRLGHLRQSQALAEAVAKQHQNEECGQYKTICLDQANELHAESLAHTLLITCGRRSAAISRRLKRAQSNLFNVQILDPRWYRKAYDLLIVPAHDRINTDNTIVIQGSLHALDTRKLNCVKQEIIMVNNDIQQPISALILGGNKEQNERLLSFVEEKCDQPAKQFIISISPRQPQINWLRYPKLKQVASCIQPSLKTNTNDAYLNLLVNAQEFFVAAESMNQLNEVLAARQTQNIWLVTDKVKGRKKRFIQHVLKLGLAEELASYHSNMRQKHDCQWREQLIPVAEKVYKNWQQTWPY